MCGRYIIREQEAAERYWRVNEPPRWIQSFNVAPTATVPIVRQAPAGSPAPNEAVLVRWGLVPYWAGGVPPKFPTFNARAEGLESTASFRGPWIRGQRCILPAAGFYEWQQRGTRKQPYFIRLAEREFFGFAGLWDRSRGADGGVLESCTLITVPANRLLAQIHNSGQRMPAILREEDHDAWLTGTLDDARAALIPYPEDLMLAWPVSPRVSSAQADDPDLIRPLPDEGDPQQELF